MSGITQILSKPDLFSIVSYDFLQAPGQLFSVSKSVNEACESVLKQKTLPELQLKSKRFWDATRTEAEQLCGEESFEVVVERLYQQMGQKFHGVGQEFNSEAWKPLQEFYEQYQKEANPKIKKDLAYRLITGLHSTNVNMDAGTEDGRRSLRYLVFEQTLFLTPAQLYITQEKLARKVADLADPQPSRALARLRETQQRYILNRGQHEQFERIPRNMGPESFLAAERFAQEMDHARDLSLGFAWRSIRPRLPEGPAHDAPANVIRPWMENDDHLPILDNLNGTLQVNLSEACPVLPLELGRCRNLQRLECQGEEAHRLIHLPEALSGMRSLEALRLDGHSFREIPAVLQRLPALRELSMRGNEHPIRIFPAGLDERINGGFERAALITIENELSQLYQYDNLLGLRVLPLDRLGHVRPWDQQYAELPYQQFTDVPFNFWFREHFSIPNLGLYAVLGGVEFILRLENIGELYAQGWLEMTRALLLPLLPMAVFLGLLIGGAIFAAPSVFLAIGIGLEISILSPVFNAILHYGIGPCIEAVRDELGYDRMVHIRDLPAAPAAATPIAQL